MSLAGRARTLGALISHFARSQHLILLPMLLILLAGGVLLLLTGGLSYVAPFIYTLF